MSVNRSAAFGLLAAFVLSGGCARIKRPSQSLTPEAASTLPATNAPDAGKGPGIRIRTIGEIRVRVGDPDGANLDGHIDAVHECTGEPVVEWVLGSPRFGALKTYGHGQVAPNGGPTRYHPPAFRCDDEIPVRLRAADGCTAEAMLPVRVTTSGGTATPTRSSTERRKPRSIPPPTVTLSSPTDGARQRGPTCTVAGSAPGLDGEHLEVVVIPRSTGVPWVQDGPFLVSAGEFRGIAHLGDDQGGAGETFRLEVRLPGGKRLAEVTVHRTE